MICNVGSANPITVAGQAVAQGQAVPLRHQDQIRIGGYLLEVQSDLVDDSGATVIRRAPDLADVEQLLEQLRFGPLTRGSCLTSTSFLSGNCTTTWGDFGSYNPTGTATDATNGDFRIGLSYLSSATTDPVTVLLQRDRNGAPRTNSNWIRGALAQ